MNAQMKKTHNLTKNKLFNILTFFLLILLMSSQKKSWAIDEGNACDDICKNNEIHERLIPRDDWDFMEGYRYKYSENCVVHWHQRTASFLVPASCQNLSNEKLSKDAIKAIAYVKKNSKYNNFYEYYESSKNEDFQTKNINIENYTIEQSKLDARKIWLQTCLNAKAMNGVPAYKFYEQYSQINTFHVARLFKNANDTVRSLGGILNCAEQSHYAADTYTSDIDIRK